MSISANHLFLVLDYEFGLTRTYKIIYKNNKFSKVSSYAVDDIREIMDEYPYFPENCVTEVYEEFRFGRWDLPDLSPDDFNTFNHPDLNNKSMTLNHGFGRVLK